MQSEDPHGALMFTKIVLQEHLDLKEIKWQEDGENWVMMRSFKICIFSRMILTGYLALMAEVRCGKKKLLKKHEKDYLR
jgi:hypothetical protein